MPVIKTFADVQNALNTFVKNNNIPIAGARHGPFWTTSYDSFVSGPVPDFPNYQILKKGDSKNSNIILALSGLPPFDGSTFPQMPLNGPYLDQPTIDAIAAWIDAGANE